jgi:ParB family transcriptional regulator, chromosome partitioning protein
MTSSLEALLSSDSVEWYTPARYVEAARAVMGGIDLDPASCALANLTVQAAAYYDKARDGLRYDWPGRVWLNPPYGLHEGKSSQEVWTARLLAQYAAGITQQAVLLVSAATETAWFQRLWAYPVCFVTPRIAFHTPARGARYKGGPTHGNACIYLGLEVDRFVSVYSQFGAVVQCISPVACSLWDEERREVLA